MLRQRALARPLCAHELRRLASWTIHVGYDVAIFRKANWKQIQVALDEVIGRIGSAVLFRPGRSLPGIGNDQQNIQNSIIREPCPSLFRIRQHQLPETNGWLADH